MRPDRTKILQAAISTFGGNQRIDRAHQSLAKLSLTLMNDRQAHGTPDHTQAQIDVMAAIADAQISLDTLRVIFGPTDSFDSHALFDLEMDVLKHGGSHILYGIDGDADTQ